MTAWVMDILNVPKPEADHLRHHYWKTYGTTLAGLMREHNIDPEGYLVDVHDISFSGLSPDLTLRSGIQSLPGRKIVYTNGTAPYAQNVLKARGLDGIFDAVYGVEHADFHPKPERRAFETVFGKDGITPSTSAMFEDDARNLAAPHDMGMRTIHVAPEQFDAPFIHHHTDDLTAFVSKLTS